MQRPLPDNTYHSQATDIHAPTEFEPTISASERPQTHDLDRAATENSSTSPIYEVQLANAVYCENHETQTFSLFGQSAEVFNPRTGGTCFNHCILKWLNVNNHLFIGVDEDSELGTAIRYRLDGPRIESRGVEEGGERLSALVQTSSAAHQASCTMGS
jgi:hypothetical protein